MGNNQLWVPLVTLGLVLSLVACGPKATPVVEKATPTPAEATPTPKPVEATPTPAAPEGVTEVEPNNGPAEATEVSMGLSTGVLTNDDEDWYKFEVPNGHVLSVAFTPAEDAQPTDVSLFTPDQEEIWWKYGVGPTVTKSATKVMNTDSGGTYYARVSGGYGSYSIELSSQSQDDAQSGGDAGDKVVDALEVQTGLAFSGQLGDFDEEDWYKFEVPNGHVLSVAFTPAEDAQPTDVSLFTPDQEETWWELSVGPTVTVAFEITEVVGGPYYIQVAYGSGSYTIEIK